MNRHAYAILVIQLRLTADQQELDMLKRRLAASPAPSENPLDCRCTFSTDRLPGQETTTTRHEHRLCPVHAPDPRHSLIVDAVARQQKRVDRLTASLTLLAEDDTK